MAVALTTEQYAPVTFSAKDGRGRPVEIESIGAVSSDETVVRAELVDGEWRLVSVAPGGPAQVVFTADLAPGEEVLEVMATVADITVTLDPRTAERVFEAVVGEAQDKPV